MNCVYLQESVTACWNDLILRPCLDQTSRKHLKRGQSLCSISRYICVQHLVNSIHLKHPASVTVSPSCALFPSFHVKATRTQVILIQAWGGFIYRQDNCLFPVFSLLMLCILCLSDRRNSFDQHYSRHSSRCLLKLSVLHTFLWLYLQANHWYPKEQMTTPTTTNFT